MSKANITPIELVPVPDYKLNSEIIAGIYKRIKREVKAFNKMQTYLRDKIRGSFFTSIKTLINDAIKIAKNGTLLEACKVALSPSMLGSYLEQSHDSGKRHIQRMKNLGFLVSIETTEEEKEALKGNKRFNSFYSINLEFLSKFLNPTPSAPTPTPDGDQDRTTTASPSAQAPSDQQPSAAMATTQEPTMTVVHNAHFAPMTVVHSTCEQLEKQQNNATERCNNTTFSAFSFRNRIFTKCLILSLLNLRYTPCMYANCAIHLAVYCFKRYKTTIRAVDMWISFREGEHYKTDKELTAKKSGHCTEAVEFLTDKGRFYTSSNVKGHLKRFGARAARRAA